MRAGPSRQPDTAAQNTKGATGCALCSLENDVASLTECARHFPDRGFASLFLGHLLVLTAPAGGDLADQSKVTALQLARRQLLGRNGGATAATSALRATARGRGSGAGCFGAIARSGGTSAAARRGGRWATTTTHSGAQRLQAPFELVDLVLHFVDVTNDLTRRNAPVTDHSVDDIRSLSRTQAGRGNWLSRSRHVLLLTAHNYNRGAHASGQ